MSKNGPCEYFCYTLFLCVAILPLQILPYQNRVVAIFSLASMAAISNSKWPIYSFGHFEFEMAAIDELEKNADNSILVVEGIKM